MGGKIKAFGFDATAPWRHNFFFFSQQKMGLHLYERNSVSIGLNVFLYMPIMSIIIDKLDHLFGVSFVCSSFSTQPYLKMFYFIFF